MCGGRCLVLEGYEKGVEQRQKTLCPWLCDITGGMAADLWHMV